MRIGGIFACVGLALLVCGCDPLERRYVTEGAGVDLYTSDRASQVELLQTYESFICAQAGPDCGTSWATFVQAGMNDIDQRCDGFLTWLDAKRRDREPILAQISAVNTAVHSIMTVTGSSPRSLDIVTAAFGLTSATYAIWNSRLLISVNQSTVQEIVYNSQGQFRDKIRNFSIPDRPAAIYLLRNYLRLCMPTTIEANINTSATLVQRGPAAAAAAAAQGNLVVANVTPVRRAPPTVTAEFGPDETTVTILNWLRPNGILDRSHRDILGRFVASEAPNVQINTFVKARQYSSLRAKFINTHIP